MNVIIHDLDENYSEMFSQKYDSVICADGKYAPCVGCFRCWTKHPARCRLKDSLMEVCRTVGKSDPLTVVSRNCYGGFSPRVKNIIDRSIGQSTPMSTYRGRQMHHTLRYGKRELLRVIVYGDMTEKEEATFRFLAERNAINFGFSRAEFIRVSDPSELEGTI